MKYLFCIVTLAIALHSTAQKHLVEDANAEIREISGSFTSIKIASGIHVYLSQGTTEAIAVSANTQQAKQNIVTQIDNNELSISYHQKGLNFGSNKNIAVYVSYNKLQKIIASGASSITLADALITDDLNIQLSGASNCKGQINAQQLKVKLSGASNMKLSGAVQNIKIECSGASDFKSYDLVAENCNIKTSGASDVHITANAEIAANASGASNIYYKGNAKIIELNSSGASSIERKN